jgi:hypothetical protein
MKFWRATSIFLLTTLCLPFVMYGQRFGGGVYVGLISSHILEQGVPSSYNKVGFFGGAFTDYRFTPKSTLQLEISFIQKGTRQLPKISNNLADIGVNLNYLEIPVLYRWWGIKNMSVEIGPQIAVLLGYKEWDQFGDFPNLNYNAFERVDFGAAVGLSYYLLKSRLEINARYAISAIPIRVKRIEAAAIWPVARQYNSLFAFSVRWWFKTTYVAGASKQKSVRSLE